MSGITENPIDIEFVDSDNVEVQEVDFEDEESVKQATDLLLQKELGEEVIEGEVEQEIVQDDHDFKVIEAHDIVSMQEGDVVETVEQVEEVRKCLFATILFYHTFHRRLWRRRPSPWPRLTGRSCG